MKRKVPSRIAPSSSLKNAKRASRRSVLVGLVGRPLEDEHAGDPEDDGRDPVEGRQPLFPASQAHVAAILGTESAQPRLNFGWLNGRVLSCSSQKCLSFGLH